MNHQLQQYLADKQRQGLYRTRQLTSAGCLNFSCNDYLSLSLDARVLQAYQTGFQLYPAGSGGSMVLSGYHTAHRDLEQAFAKALSVDDCLLFSSGYVANLAVVSLLAQFGVHALIDKAVHASIYDGLRLSGISYSRFAHNDLMSLELQLATAGAQAMVITESVFSMSGQQAPISAIATLAATYGCGLIVDEAHGFGVIGSHGMGGTHAAGLSQTDVPLRIIPFGKALAGSGAVVVGQAVWIDALLQATRQPVYSTSISPAMAYGMLMTLQMLQEADDRRQHLTHLVTYFRQCIQHASYTWRDSLSPIQQLQLGCPHRAMQITEKLAENRIRCFAIRQPTVPKQDSGLRIVLNYHHTTHDIDRLFEVLST